MSSSLIDWFIFFTTSATFVVYKRRRRIDVEVYTKKLSAPIEKNSSGNGVIVRSTGRNEAITSEKKLQQEDPLREKYKPWCMTPSAFNENQKGWVYARGYSPIKRGGSGSVLFFRPGLHKLCKDRYEAYFRALLNSIEVCVVDSLQRSNGRIGKCNVILDAKGVGLSFIPPIQIAKKILPLCQRLFAGHLGIVVITSMGGPAQIFFKMILQFIPVEVRKKIHILPNRGKERLEILKTLVEDKFIPIWLGGKDDYAFNATEYYKTGTYKSNFITDQQGVEYSRR